MTKRRRGVTAVELALVSPFLFFLVFGSIEFSRMVMVKQALTNAAREGSRWAALATTQNPQQVEDEIRHRLKGAIAGYADVNEVRVTVSPQLLSACTSGTPITTHVEVDCADVSWIPSVFLAGMVLDSKAEMNRE